MGGRIGVCSRGWMGQAVQQAGSVFTVQWLPSRGEPLRGLLEKLWQGWGDAGAEARAWSCPWHHEPSQAGPEGRAGIPSPPGHQQRAVRQVEGADPLWAVSADQQARKPSLLVFRATHLYGKSSDTVLPCESHASLSGDESLLVGVGIPWHQAGPRAQGLFHSSAPTLLSHVPWASGSLAQVLAWRGMGGGHSP